MVGTLETLSPNPLASLGASRISEALAMAQPPREGSGSSDRDAAAGRDACHHHARGRSRPRP